MKMYATSTRGIFNGATAFNQDIGNWQVYSVYPSSNWESAFYGTTSFNQNLRYWCVTSIPSEPSSFAVGSALTAENKPVWGSCPVRPPQQAPVGPPANVPVNSPESVAAAPVASPVAAPVSSGQPSPTSAPVKPVTPPAPSAKASSAGRQSVDGAMISILSAVFLAALF
jgi:hypothetical protein